MIATAVIPLVLAVVFVLICLADDAVAVLPALHPSSPGGRRARRPESRDRAAPHTRPAAHAPPG